MTIGGEELKNVSGQKYLARQKESQNNMELWKVIGFGF